MRWRATTRVLLLAALAVGLLGCGEDESGIPSEEVADQLADALVSSVPAGFEPAGDDVNGPAGLTTVSFATAVDPPALEKALEQAGFEGGYTRVWRDGEASLSGVAMQVASDEQAREVVRLAVEELERSQYTIVEPLTGVPDAHRFLVNGKRRAGKDTVFCQGAWLPVQRQVFTFTHCAPYPVLAGVTELLARQQAEDARDGS